MTAGRRIPEKTQNADVILLLAPRRRTLRPLIRRSGDHRLCFLCWRRQRFARGDENAHRRIGVYRDWIPIRSIANQSEPRVIASYKRGFAVADRFAVADAGVG